MKNTIRALVGVAALSAAVCLSSVAFADEPPAAAGMSGPSSPDQRADRMREHVQAKARALHDILAIRPDQDGAFQAMIESMQPEGRDMGMHGDRDDMDQMTTPQRLDWMASRMAEKQAEFQRHADAVRRLYAVLNPDQQRAFDALQGMMMDGDHDGMGGEHMHHHGDGDRDDD